MKWMNLTIWSACVAMGLTTAVQAEDELEFEFTADLFGKYVWRGQNLSDDPVFQAGLSVGYKGLTVATWGNLDLTDINGNREDFSELDHSIDYSGRIPGVEGVGFSIGAIYYDFPGTMVKDTTELYWGLNLSAPLDPSVTFYHDVDEADGTYISFGLGHSVERIFELGPAIPVGVELGASLGWGDGAYNKYYWGLSSGRVNDLTLSASFPFELAGWTVVPSLNYVMLLDSGIRRTDAYRTESDYFFAGIGFVKEF